MMGRQRWRGLWDRGATATAAPEDTACAGDDGPGPADPGPGGTRAGPDPGLAGQHGPANALQRWLAGAPFHLHRAGLAQLSNRVLTFLKQHQSAVAGTVLSGGKIFLEFLAGLVLTLFVTFFLLKDGERIWAWLTSFLGHE